MTVDRENKLVSVWLTQAESQDTAVQAQLEPVYRSYRQQKYTVAVYHAGREDLYQNTLDLLRFNRRRSAEQTVRRTAP